MRQSQTDNDGKYFFAATIISGSAPTVHYRLRGNPTEIVQAGYVVSFRNAEAQLGRRFSIRIINSTRFFFVGETFLLWCNIWKEPTNGKLFILTQHSVLFLQIFSYRSNVNLTSMHNSNDIFSFDTLEFSFHCYPCSPCLQAISQRMEMENSSRPFPARNEQ